jgi:rhodanese-related sulfurtransferase
MKFLIDNYLYLVLMFVSGGMLLWPLIQKRTQGVTVNPNGAIALINNENAQLIDVRSSEAFIKGRIAQAKNVPAEEVAARAAELAKAHECIVVQGDASKSAVQAAALLRAAGASRVAILDGGYAAWLAAGLPIVKK